MKKGRDLLLIPNQDVQIKWNYKNKKWYTERGYEFTEYGKDLIVKIEDVMSSINVYVDVQCDYCGKIFKKKLYDYKVEISKTIPKCACAECNGKKKSETLAVLNRDAKIEYFNDFLNICKQNGYIPISTCCNNRTQFRLEYICPIHGTQNSTLQYLKDNGCPECKKDNKHAVFMKKHLHEFEELCNAKGYTSLAKLEDCNNIDTPLPYLCPIHGLKYGTIHNMKYRGDGCQECGYQIRGNELRLTQDDVKKEIESKNGNIWKNYGEYQNAITNNLEVICGSCSNVFVVSQNNYKKNITGKCPECNVKSYGEYIILNYLKDRGISYTTQESFGGDCRNINPLRFDFYLLDYNLCIEFDGRQHFDDHFYWGFFDTKEEAHQKFEENKKHDEIKNEYCKTHGIDLLRISYLDGNNIEEILDDYLGIKFKKIKYIPTAERKKIIGKTQLNK